MAMAARSIEPLERALSEVPQGTSADMLARVAAGAASPEQWMKALLAEQRAASKTWIEKVRGVFLGMIDVTKSPELLAASRDLISAHIQDHLVKIEANQRDSEALRNTIPPVASLKVLRGLERGLNDILRQQHDALVETYYEFMAALAEQDREAQPTGEPISSAADLRSFFDRVRSS